MSENTQNKNVHEEEIDLLDLFRRIGNTLKRGAKGLGRIILISIVFLIKKWLPLGISVIAGLGLAFFLKSTSDSVYNSDLVLRNNLVSNSDMIAYINRLKTFCKESNFAALSDALAIDNQKVKNISEISAYWIIDQGADKIPDYVDYKNNHDVYDTINVRMNDRLDISVKINSPQDLSIVRDGIISFIQKDTLFQQRNRVRVRQNYEMLARLDYDILQLDSLQKIKYFEETKSKQPQSGSQMIFLQEQKTQLIYTDIQTLYARKQALEAERDLFKGIITVLSDFSIPTRRENGGFYYSKFTVSILFLLTLIALICFANRKKIKDIFNKY